MGSARARAVRMQWPYGLTTVCHLKTRVSIASLDAMILGLGHRSGHNGSAVMGDRATQECDPSTATVPYGTG